VILLTTLALADTCESYSEAEALTPIKDKRIDEASGVVELRTRPGVWVTHNDAGGVPALYTFNLDGELLDTLSVLGATNDDWEDIAAGPCPISDGHCLYIGDIGDNARDRESILVYAVPEPAEDDLSLSVEATWEATWPDGPADSEALVFHPCTRQLSVITKVSNAPAEVWSFPVKPGKGTLTFVTQLDLYTMKLGNYRVTGADWDESGERLAIRTYGDILEWRTDPADPSAHWSSKPDVHLISNTGQLESIAYDLGGDLVSITEGEVTRIFRWTCEGLEEGADCPTEEPADTGDSGTPDTGDTDTDTDTDTDPADSGDTDDPTDSGDPADTGAIAADGDCACRGGSALLLPLLVLLGRRRGRDTAEP
jgi:hypothetical protein